MKKLIFISSLLAFLFCGYSSKAQNFKSAIGARLGSPLSATFKTFLNESNAIEIYLGTRGSKGRFGFDSWRWWSISGAYQKHKPLELGDFDGLKYYYGFGASVYIWTFDFQTDAATTAFGVQGYAGLSYSFDNMPINITVDWIPTYFINGFGSGFGADFGSLGIRYVLGK